MSRVLGRRRLSRSTEESTSFERQGEIISSWSSMHDHEIVDWADDLDVSGGLSPFETPGLSPWLSDPEKLDQWDILAAWKLDRLGRTLFGLNDLFKWCQENGKTLVCVQDNIDLSHWTGRLVATVIAGVAEGELENIKARTQGSQKKLRELGRWHGGTVPYGYKAVKTADGYRLQIDDKDSKVAREIVARVLDQEAVWAIAQDLTARGIPSRRNRNWSAQAITRMLRSRWIIGQQEHRGRVILGDDGLPLQRAEPLIEEREWKAVQALLDDRRRPKKRKNPTGLLLGVAKCALCGELLYHNVMNQSSRGTEYRYWRCSGKSKKRNGCPAQGIRSDVLEGFVEEQFLSDVGDYERTEKVFVPATGLGEESERVTTAIERIRKEADLGLYDDDEEGYLSRLSSLVARKKELEASPSHPARWELRGLGETYREAWERQTIEERRLMLIEHGVTVTAKAAPFEASISIPEEMLVRKIPGWEPKDAEPLPGSRGGT